jgi:hypothetical protein
MCSAQNEAFFLLQNIKKLDVRMSWALVRRQMQPPKHAKYLDVFNPNATRSLSFVQTLTNIYSPKIFFPFFIDPGGGWLVHLEAHEECSSSIWKTYGSLFVLHLFCRSIVFKFWFLLSTNNFNFIFEFLILIWQMFSLNQCQNVFLFDLMFVHCVNTTQFNDPIQSA